MAFAQLYCTLFKLIYFLRQKHLHYMTAASGLEQFDILLMGLAGQKLLETKVHNGRCGVNN